MCLCLFFFFNDTATTDIYTLSLHDALPILNGQTMQDHTTGDMIFDVPALIESLSSTLTLRPGAVILTGTPQGVGFARKPDRKSTRLNSSHANISYAVFCLKKKLNTLSTPLS